MLPVHTDFISYRDLPEAFSDIFYGTSAPHKGRKGTLLRISSKSFELYYIVFGKLN